MQPQNVYSENSQQPMLVWIAAGHEGYGVAAAIIEFSLELSKFGWAVVCVCQTRGDLSVALQSKAVSVLCLDQPTVPPMVSGSLVQRFRTFGAAQRSQKQLILSATRELQGKNVQVVQTCNQLLLGATAKIAKRVNAQAVWRMANSVRPRPPFDYMRWYLQLQCYTGNILAMANSAFTANSMGRGPARVCHNHHGCDGDKFSTLEHSLVVERSTLGLKPHSSVLGVVARFDESGDKGQLRLVEALNQMGSAVADKNIEVLLIGGPTEGKLAEKIRQLTDQPWLKDRVHLLGKVDQVEKYYPLIDILVNLRLSAEPFGLTVIEAMMMQRPVLAHQLGGPSETVVDGRTGWLFGNTEVAAVIAAVQRALADNASWEKFGQAGGQRARELFSLDQEVLRWITLINQHRRPGAPVLELQGKYLD